MLICSVKKGNNGVDLLASLCNTYNTSEDELKKTTEKTNSLIAQILKKKPHLASECKSETLENIDPGFHLKADSLNFIQLFIMKIWLLPYVY